MRFTFGRSQGSDVRNFVKILQSFSRFGEFVRVVASGNSLRIEALKDLSAFGVITVKRCFFKTYHCDEPLDINFSSRTIRLVFSNASYWSKKLIQLDVLIEQGYDFAIFRQSMENYERFCRVRLHDRLEVNDLDFGDYLNDPVRLRCNVRLLTDGIRHINTRVQLVVFRIRDRNIKVETGDEEVMDTCYSTQFYFFVEEFGTYVCSEEVTVSFSLKILRQFLSAWDKDQEVCSYFREGTGIVFTADRRGFSAQLMMCAVTRDHRPNSPPPSGNNTTASINVTYPSIISNPNDSFTNVSINRTALQSNNETGMGDSIHSTAQTAQQSMQADDEEQFDDSLDEFCTIDPEAASHIPSPRTSTALEDYDHDFDRLEGPTQPMETDADSHLSQPFDPHVFSQLQGDETVLKTSRDRLGWRDMLDTSRRHTDRRAQDSDDEYIFED